MAPRASPTRSAASRRDDPRSTLVDRDLARLLVAGASWYATDVTSLVAVSVTVARLLSADARQPAARPPPTPPTG